VLEAGAEPEPRSAEQSVETTVRFGDPIVVPLDGVDACPHPANAGPPRARIGSAAPGGPLPPALVTRVIRRARDAFTPCYVSMPSHETCRNADVAVQLDVSGEGQPLQCVGTAEDPGLGPCTAQALMGLRFPEPDGPGAVRLRFTLQYRVAPP